MFEWEINGRHLYIREAQTEPEFHLIEEIQRIAWQFDDLDVVPFAHLIAAQWAGGTVLCAFERDTMIGFVYGFPAFEHGHPSVHSHMLAVRPEYRNLQAGYYLKLAQRERVLEKGISEISWTFDPLQSLNAHLNFGKLGVVSDRYIVNFYGEASSSPLHKGFGTDRLWVSWLLDSDRVRQLVDDRKQTSQTDTGHPGSEIYRSNLPLLVRKIDDQPACDLNQLSGVDRCLIEIPHDIASLKERDPVGAQRWRQATRSAFTIAIESGFLVRDFVQLESKPFPRWVYLLVRNRP
jgi:predicted GNAT superfamily acetyltransferase